MKTIVWEKPSELDIHFSEIKNTNNFVIDKKIYEYFLIEVHDKGLKNYVKERDKELGEIIEIDSDKYINESDNKSNAAYKYSEAKFKVEREFAVPYNKQRKKYYVHKNYIYSFTYLGMMNSPNEINLIRYDLEDTATLLNKYLTTLDIEQNKSIWNLITEKINKS